MDSSIVSSSKQLNSKVPSKKVLEAVRNSMSASTYGFEKTANLPEGWFYAGLISAYADVEDMLTTDFLVKRSRKGKVAKILGLSILLVGSYREFDKHVSNTLRSLSE